MSNYYNPYINSKNNMFGLSNNDFLKAYEPYKNINGTSSTTGTTGIGKTSGGFQWGTFGDIMGGIGSIGQGLMGLGNAFTGYKNYKLAKEAFGFQKALAQKNLANQAQLINNAIDASANISAGLSSIPTAGDKYNVGLRDKIMSEADKTKVSGSL